MEGWQAKKAQNVYQGIRTKLQNADLIKVMAASGVFGSLIGERKLRALHKARPELFDLSKTYTTAEIRRKLADVAGFKDRSATPIIENLGKFQAWIAKLPITFRKEVAVKAKGSKFANQIVVFTGVRDKDAETKIVEQGGSIGSGVSAKTTLLVAKDPNDSSSKLEKARSLGIKIVSLPQLQKLLQ